MDNNLIDKVLSITEKAEVKESEEGLSVELFFKDNQTEEEVQAIKDLIINLLETNI